MVKEITKHPKLASLILTILYIVGLIGILLPLHPDFILLTPLNLLLSLIMMLSFHPNWTNNMTLFIVIAFVIGLSIEIIGVQTGLVFGNYNYGRVLGFKLWDTPIMIGVNWVLVSYCAAIAAQKIVPKQNDFIKTAIGASILVVLDFLIEPVAMYYDFWSWENNRIPIQNYIAWFVIAYVLIFLFFRIVGKQTNKVALTLLALQFMFFGVLNLI